MGMNILLDALTVDSNYAVLIADHLAAKKVRESADRMILRLRSSKAEEIDLIVGFLRALAELRVEIPNDLIKRFREPSMPWQIRRTIEEISSSGN